MVLITAFLFDILIGDPRSMPHPVRWIGSMIGYLEAKLYPCPCSKRLTGIILTLIVLSVTYCCTFLAGKVFQLFHPSLAFFLNSLVLFTTLSVRSLYSESMKVCHGLEAGDLCSARKQVSMIVGRDTETLSQEEVSRAAVETVSENIVDGIVSPIFWWIVGGIPLAMAYKAVNTLDSMVGYKNERYGEFGWASARFDDLLNYVPARISFFLIVMAAFLSGKEWRMGVATGLRDGRKNPSPNAGIPEAVVAGVLQVELGGTNFYGGVPSPKERIGDRVEKLSTRHIREVNKVMLVTALIAVCVGAFFGTS